MTAHKHAEMIKAKADNMELVVFEKDPSGWLMRISDIIHMNPSKEYFLCLPKHKEACLHWLNGGLIEYNSNLTNRWEGCADYNECIWRLSCGMMREDANYRIKPRKEKLWIGYHKYRHTTTKAYATKDDAKSDTVDHDKWQFIEIEVEV